MTNFENDIEKCLSVLKSGGIILYPTDTIWGIGCDATNAAAVAKIYALKKRAEEKSMIILLASQKELNQYIAHLDPAVFDFLHQTIKPTTVIYDGAIGLADNVVSNDGTIAIRITSDVFCQQLIKRFRRPIVSTSANISGQVSPTTFAAIGAEIKNGVDYIVQHRQDDLCAASPSAIIRWQKTGQVVVIRP